MRIILCKHKWVKNSSITLDLPTEGTDPLTITSFTCKECNDTLPGLLQICTFCYDLQSQGAQTRIYNALVADTIGSCDLCGVTDKIMQIVL